MSSKKTTSNDKNKGTIANNNKSNSITSTNKKTTSSSKNKSTTANKNKSNGNVSTNKKTTTTKIVKVDSNIKNDIKSNDEIIIETETNKNNDKVDENEKNENSIKSNDEIIIETETNKKDDKVDENEKNENIDSTKINDDIVDSFRSKSTRSNIRTLPWHKKRGTIIVASSILSIGLLVTAIAVPVSLASKTNVNTNQATVNILNKKENKTNRLSVWNSYISHLNTPTSSGGIINTSFNKIIRGDKFINEFIGLITNNLLVDDTTKVTQVGSITSENLVSLKSELQKNKESFKNDTITTYDSLFSFEASTSMKPMFTFKNATIEFSLFMPLTTVGSDIIYNNHKSVSLLMPEPSINPNDNVRLTITKFTTPNIIAPTNYYFKAGKFDFPSSIKNEFPTFFNDIVSKEEITRKSIKQDLENISKSMKSNAAIGLSYWNSFAMNYSVSNLAHLTTDLEKTITDSKLLSFLKTNASGVTNFELEQIKELAKNKNTFNLNQNPFASISPKTNYLFNTSNNIITDIGSTNKPPAVEFNKYSLELNITNFNYNFAINNLFDINYPISITPELTFDGVLTKTTMSSGTSDGSEQNNLAKDPITKTYPIGRSAYDVSSLISMSSTSEFSKGGLIGYFNELIQTTPNEISKFTNNLITANKKSVNEKINWWNDLANNVSNKTAIEAAFKTPDILADFIFDNIDFTNPSGYGEFKPVLNTNNSTKSLDKDFMKDSLNKKLGTLSFSRSLSLIKRDGNNHFITLNDISWGSKPGQSFDSMHIYFSGDLNTIDNINIASRLTNNFNVGFTQKLGATNNLSSRQAVHRSANERISIVFGNISKVIAGVNIPESNFVFYLGQYKSGNSQARKPITIPNSILDQTNFLQTINPIFKK